MPTDAMEDELLRSIEEVDARIQSLRKDVRAVLRSAPSRNVTLTIEKTEGARTAAPAPCSTPPRAAWSTVTSNPPTS